VRESKKCPYKQLSCGRERIAEKWKSRGKRWILELTCSVQTGISSRSIFIHENFS